MRKSTINLAVLFAMGCSVIANAQEAPTLEEVYGGRVTAISAVELDSGVTRLFAATESANSVFYADVDHSRAAPFDTAADGFRFQIVPDLDANANFGNVNGIAGHPGSGKLFVSHDTGLFTCTTNAGSILTNYSGQALGALLLADDVLLILGGNRVFWGMLTEAGDLGAISEPLDTGIAQPCFNIMATHPVSNRLLVMDRDNGLVIKKSSDTIDALTTATTFSDITVDNVITGWQGRTFNIAPDGRIFVAGSQANKMIVFSDNEIDWTTVDTGIGGAAGELCFIGNSNAYMVVCGSAMSSNKGVDGSWVRIPHPGGAQDSNPNDGPAAADPNSAECFYFTTDLAIGATTNGGADIFDICEGMAAVQISDFDMTEDKNVAWTASKSGVHRATGFPDAPVWSKAMFPQGNGSPYYSVAVDRADTNGLTAFAGNNNIYKTTDGGAAWTLCYSPPPGAESGFFISCIKVSDPMVMAGIYYNNPGQLGGLLVSTNSGADFTYYELAGETAGLNINDILFADDGVYIAAAYDTNAISGAGQIYRMVMGGADEKIGLSDEPVSIRKLCEDADGGLYAVGMYADYSPALFYRMSDADSWTELATDGLPADVRPQANPNWRGPVIAVGVDSNTNNIPIIAVGVKLYFLANGAAEWTTSDALTYPNGTQINVLYWDDLMVGTDIGLYAQPTRLDPPEPENEMNGVAADFDGDGRCDLAAMTDDGTWYVWLSSQNYSLSAPFALGVTGAPAAGDFDGDGRADPVILDDLGRLVICYSLNNYAPSAPMQLGCMGAPVAADFDGDGRPDLAVMSDAGAWTVRYSSENYLIVNGPYTLGVTGTPAGGDFDGDGKADPVVNNDQTGRITAWYSGNHYQKEGPFDLGITGELLVGDFDGDGRPDLLEVRDDGGDMDEFMTIYLRLAAGGYGNVIIRQLPAP